MNHTPKHRKPTPHRHLPLHYIAPRHCNCGACETRLHSHFAESSAPWTEESA